MHQNYNIWREERSGILERLKHDIGIGDQRPVEFFFFPESDSDI